MSTGIWKGHVSFGMVSFPVKLYAAAHSQTISFFAPSMRSLTGEAGPAFQIEDKPVSRSELIKGFEYEKDR